MGAVDAVERFWAAVSALPCHAAVVIKMAASPARQPARIAAAVTGT